MAPIEVSDDDATALGVTDKSKLAGYLEKFETDRTRARQAVIDQKDGALRAFTDLGLTADQVKELRDAAKNTPSEKDIEKDVEKRIADALKTAQTEQTAKADARARASEVRAQAAELGFIKPAQALALLDGKRLTEVKVDDAGDADPAAVKTLLEELAKDSPHLLKPTDTTADHRSAGIGATGSGAKSEAGPGLPRLRQAYADTTK